MRTYRGTTIESPDYRGYYRARVLIGTMRTGYYVALQADSLVGIKSIIRETLANAGQTRESMV